VTAKGCGVLGSSATEFLPELETSSGSTKRQQQPRDNVLGTVRARQFHIWIVEEANALQHRHLSDRLDEFARTLRAASAGEEKNPQEGSN